MTRDERRRLWVGRIDECKRSGLTQRAYCVRESIAYTTFKGWRRRIGRAGAPAVKPGRFVPVRVAGAGESHPAQSLHAARPDEALSASAVQIRLASGRALVLEARFGEVELGRLIRLLEVLPC